MQITILKTATLFLVCTSLAACNILTPPNTPEPETITQYPADTYNVGEYYSVFVNDSHRIVKIIQPWQDTLVLALYKNSFPEPQASVDQASLYLYNDEAREARTGVDGLPVPVETFESWQPQLVGTGGEISDLEMSNFDYWKEAGPDRWYFPDDYPNAATY